MKLKFILLSIFTISIISCSAPTNSPEFIENSTGKYLFNSDEIVEVYFENTDLLIKWRGANKIKPLKIDNQTFFIKEMNEKIQFVQNSGSNNYISVVPKKDTDTLKRIFRKLKDGEKIPSEYINENNFEKALAGYLSIKKNDSLDKSLNEGNFNKLGYKALRNKNYTKALNVFKINMELYPNSANVYDSYADALKVSGDTIKAVEYYKKSLAIDSGNRNAKKFVKKYDTSKK